MATTSNTITATAGQTEFSFSFPYLKKESIRVTIDDVGTNAFTIPDNNPTTVILNSGATAGQVIKILRITSTTATPATFFSGGAIRSQDLNNNFDSILYITQEKENQITEVIAGNIADGSITASKLADQSVGTSALINGGVATVDLADNAVTTAKIINDAVTTDKIVNAAVTTDKIVNAAVTTDKIADSSVNTDKLAATVILLPTGAITAFGGSTAPTGYLECNGQSTAGYAALAAIVGANVPDLRGEFVRGWDNSRGVDTGRTLGSSQEATETRTAIDAGGGNDTDGGNVRLGHQFRQADTQNTRSSSPSDGFVGDGVSLTAISGDLSDNAAKATLDTDAVTNSQNVWISHRPRNIALMYIIKT